MVRFKKFQNDKFRFCKSRVQYISLGWIDTFELNINLNFEHLKSCTNTTTNNTFGNISNKTRIWALVLEIVEYTKREREHAQGHSVVLHSLGKIKLCLFSDSLASTD